MNIILDEKGYIDLIESRKRRFSKEVIEDKDNIKKILLTSSCMLSAEVACYLSDLKSVFSPKSALVQLIILGIGSYNIYNALFEKIKSSDILKIIESSISYNECKSLYEEYIKNLVSFLKSINISESLDISRFFDVFLNNGYFSATEKHEWKDYKYTEELYISKILGSYIMSGTAVCRHAASMLTDILNEGGFKACNISVSSHNLENCLNNKVKLKLQVRPNHLITGIIDNNEKYAYDPTLQGYVMFDTSYAKNLGFSSQNFLIHEDNKNYYRISSNVKFIHKCFNYKEEINYELFSSYNPKTISEDYDNASWDRLIESTDKYINEIKDFHREQLPKLQKIKELNKSIAPYSNTKITEWKII